MGCAVEGGRAGRAEAQGIPAFLLQLSKSARSLPRPSGRCQWQHRGSYPGSFDHDDHGSSVHGNGCLQGPQHRGPMCGWSVHSGVGHQGKAPLHPFSSLQTENDAAVRPAIPWERLSEGGIHKQPGQQNYPAAAFWSKAMAASSKTYGASPRTPAELLRRHAVHGACFTVARTPYASTIQRKYRYSKRSEVPMRQHGSCRSRRRLISL